MHILVLQKHDVSVMHPFAEFLNDSRENLKAYIVNAKAYGIVKGLRV